MKLWAGRGWRCFVLPLEGHARGWGRCWVGLGCDVQGLGCGVWGITGSRITCASVVGGRAGVGRRMLGVECRGLGPGCQVWVLGFGRWVLVGKRGGYHGGRSCLGLMRRAWLLHA